MWLMEKKQDLKHRRLRGSVLKTLPDITDMKETVQFPQLDDSLKNSHSINKIIFKAERNCLSNKQFLKVNSVIPKGRLSDLSILLLFHREQDLKVCSQKKF